jgi:ribosomal protein S18 acetylase RimI-like enzyme
MENPTQPLWLSQIEIRLLREADLLALEWGGEYRHFRRLYQDIYQGVLQGRALMWVVDLSGAGIIGQVFVQLNSGRKELADGETRAYLYGFRVQPTYRRFGVGGSLLRVVESNLLARGFRCATLNVGRNNRDARRFYERYGYVVVADEPGRWSYLDDQGRRREVHEPAWRMEKLLRPA